MNYLLFSTCCQLSRRLNLSPNCTFKLPSFISQKACFTTTTPVLQFHPRISRVSNSTQQALRKQYNLSDEFFVIYKEPKQELNSMIYAKCIELIAYGSPLWAVCCSYYYDTPLASFLEQEHFFVGCGIITLYLLFVRFFVNGFVRIIFHNKTTDVYRAYVLNKYFPTYKYVEFKAEDVKVINLPPSIVMARNFFRAGKQNLILHDGLFANGHEEEKLIGGALELWQAKWKK